MSHEMILTFFAKYIESELGIVYANHNYFQLQNRLEEIAKLLGVEGLDGLRRHANNGIHGQFRQLLLDVATNNETSFFRDPKVFKAIEASVLPLIMDLRRNGEPMKVWSAASSTGQEALSMAILITEWMKKNHLSVPYKIIGTDISERVLAKATSALYSQLEVQRGMPASCLLKYFEKDVNDNWKAKPEIAQHTEFKKMNLREPFLAISGKFHLVLCRNVLIYQSIESRIEILSRVTDTIVPGGFLIMGSGESLLGLSDDYEQQLCDGAVVYRKKDRATLAA